MYVSIYKKHLKCFYKVAVWSEDTDLTLAPPPTSCVGQLGERGTGSCVRGESNASHIPPGSS